MQAIWRKTASEYTTFQSFYAPDKLSGGNIPNTKRFICGAGDKKSRVRREAANANTAFVPLKNSDHRACVNIP